MTRLTNTLRDTIRHRAIGAAFSEREAELKANEHRLGMEAYDAVIPEAERIAAAGLPERWCRYDRCLRFNAGGWDVRLDVEKSVPVFSGYGCHRLGDITGDLAERIQAHVQAKEALRKDKARAEHELDGFLAQFKSLKQMAESWPEGNPFYADLDIDRKPGGVPAVRVMEINKLLNLGEAA